MTPDTAARNLFLDTQWHELSFGNERIRLTPIETRLLRLLLKEPGRPLPQTTIAEALWGSAVDGTSGRLDVHVHNLRAKLRLLAGESGLIERRANALRFNPGNLQNAEIVVR